MKAGHKVPDMLLDPALQMGAVKNPPGNPSVAEKKQQLGVKAANRLVRRKGKI